MIRLACHDCDVNSHGPEIPRVPRGWHDVIEVQSLAESYDTSDPDAMLTWFTHIGICPKCWAAEPDKRNGFQFEDMQ